MISFRLCSIRGMDRRASPGPRTIMNVPRFTRRASVFVLVEIGMIAHCGVPLIFGHA